MERSEELGIKNVSLLPMRLRLRIPQNRETNGISGKNAKSGDQPFINNYELRKNAHTNLEVSRAGGCFFMHKNMGKHIENKLNLPQRRSCCLSCLSI